MTDEPKRRRRAPLRAGSTTDDPASEVDAPASAPTVDEPAALIRSALEDFLPGTGRKELLAVLLIALTSVMTAWTAFQASKWGGEMSQFTARAAASRVESVRSSGFANQQFITDSMLFSDWLSATLSDDEGLAALYQERFSPELEEAFFAWADSDDSITSPFVEGFYVLEADVEAVALEDEAVRLTAAAAEANQTGDDYTLTTVIFATVLLLAALSTKVKAARTENALLVIAAIVFVGTSIVVLTFPKVI